MWSRLVFVRLVLLSIADLPLPAAAAAALLRLRGAAAQWPKSLSLTTPGPLRRSVWAHPAEDPMWNRVQRRWRDKVLQRTLQGDKDFQGLIGDELGSYDGPFWDNVTDLAPQEEGAFWATVCNSTTGDGGGDEAVKDRPLDGWDVQNASSCDVEQQIPGEEFTSESEAELHCGVSCASVLDVGCERKRFRLCKVGFEAVPSPERSCLRHRLPDHRPPAGKPANPKEAAFWKAFCEKALVPFRLLWANRLCTSAKELAGADSEGECAEKTIADSSCGEVFDFQQATPPVCRCAKKGTACSPKPTTTAELDAAVFILLPRPDQQR